MQSYVHIFSAKPLITACLIMWALLCLPVSTPANATKHRIFATSHPATLHSSNARPTTDKRKTPEQTALLRMAHAQMERVFAYVETHGYDSLQYTSEVYLRHNMYTKRKGPIMRYIPEMLRLEKGYNSYFSEAQLRLQYRQPDQIDCKIVAYHSTSRYQRAQRFTSMERFTFQIYDSKLFFDCILNPLHRRNRRFYQYTPLVHTNSLNDSIPIARIRITPRFSNDQLVEGDIELNSRTGAVRKFVFNMHYKMQHLSVTAHMEGNGYESLLPYKVHLVSKFKLMGNEVYETASIHSRHTFSCTIPEKQSHASRYDLTTQCLVKIDTTRIITDKTYFDAIRPYPLNKIEQRIIDNEAPTANKSDHFFSEPVELPKFAGPMSTDSIKQHTSPPASSSPPIAANDSIQPDKDNDLPLIFNERTQNLLLSSHFINLGKHSRIKLPAIITPSMVGWSRAKGFSLKTRARWELHGSNAYSGPLMQIAPSIGYSFKQKQIYWDLPFLLRLLPQYNGLFTLKAGGGDHMYNSRQADELRHKLENVEKYDSILHIIDHYGFHDYRDLHLKSDFSLSPTPGLRFTLGMRYHRRALIDWNKLAEVTNLKRHFSSIGPRLQVEWTPSQYYYRDGIRKIPLYSPCPTMLFSYERGYALGRGMTHYERFEADVRYCLSLYAMRKLYFRAGGGIYTQKGTDCFLDYDYFKFNFMPEEWTDDLTGEYQLLSSRWYNESRYYLRFTSTYESPMLMFSRMPYLSKFVQKERVYLNLLSVRNLGFYTEMGYGISTYPLDFGLFVGIAPDHSLDFGCKVILKLFDD